MVLFLHCWPACIFHQRTTLELLLDRSWLQANAPQYWRIDTSQPLCSQLQGRTVIEFPTLLVHESLTSHMASSPGCS